MDTHRPGTLCASCGALQLNLSCNRIGEKDNVGLAWFRNYKWLEDSGRQLQYPDLGPQALGKLQVGRGKLAISIPFPSHFQIGSQPSCQVDGAKALAEAQTSTCFWLDIWLDLCDFLLEQDLVRVSCYILSVYYIRLYRAGTSDLCFPFWPATIHRPWWQGLVHNSHLEHLARNSDIPCPATGWSCRGMDVQPLLAQEPKQAAVSMYTTIYCIYLYA